MLATILIFIAVLSVLVFVHELGHFIAAKRSDIAVEEFGMGLPPRIWGKKYGETLYSVNLLPIGGFVRLKGEDFAEEAPEDPRNFSAKSSLVRARVLLAGVFSNFILAILLLTILFAVGVPVLTDQIYIKEVQRGAEAERSGLKSGDVILSLDGEQFEFVSDFVDAVKVKSFKKVSLKVKRGEEEFMVTAVPSPILGVVITNFKLQTYPLYIAPKKGVEAAFNISGGMIKGLWYFVKDVIFKRYVSPDVAGPVGIARLTSQASEMGARFLLQFVGILSLNLAVINILPFPALDGGRLIFVVLEGVAGKKVSPKVERWVHTLGLALLLLLLVVVTLKDISNLR